MQCSQSVMYHSTRSEVGEQDETRLGKERLSSPSSGNSLSSGFSPSPGVSPSSGLPLPTKTRVLEAATRPTLRPDLTSPVSRPYRQKLVHHMQGSQCDHLPRRRPASGSQRRALFHKSQTTPNERESSRLVQ